MRVDSRVIALGAGCALAGFLVATLIFGAPWHFSPDFGDLPTWLAAIAAIAAGIIAYQVYSISAQERRSAQASKIAAWYGLKRPPGAEAMEGVFQTTRPPAPKWGAFLRNASDLPVYDVAVKFYFPDSGTGDKEWNLHTINKRVLPPSDTPIHEQIDDAALRIYSEDPKMDAFHRIEIEFTDSKGIRWHRNFKGQLSEIT